MTTTYVDAATRMEVPLPPLVASMAGVSDGELAALSQQIRTECGWHVAPRLAATITMSNEWADHSLVLPTKHVTDVLAVRVRDRWGGVMRPLNGWDAATGWDPSGVITCDYLLPKGMRVIEVDLVHGYAECPADLTSFMTRMRRGRIVQESLAGRSVTYASGDSFRMSPVIGKYRLEPYL